MADAYRTRGDVSIPRVIAVQGEGEDHDVLTESVTYPAGSYLLAENLTPRDRERASNGELDHLLEEADVETARAAVRSQAGGPEEDFAIFVPEHEAEAHAMDVYGHTVVPPQQALELGSASAEWAEGYQNAVREHGLDRRPVQEHFAQERERVPDELLAGGQHRTGLPHERGPAGFGEGEAADAENQQERAEQQRQGGRQVEAEVAANAPRQRPGTETQAQAPQQSEAASGGGSERTGESTSTQASPAQEQNPPQPTNPAPAQQG